MLKVTIAFMIWLHIRETVQQKEFGCGVQQAHQKPLILNGEAAERNEWPWHVALFRRSDDSMSYICGGTLISNQFVLTAAHCVFSKGEILKPSNITTYMGRHNIRKYDTETIQQSDVAVIHVHPTFMPNSLKDDIALLELRTSVKFDEYVQPACVDQEKDFAGDIGTTVGWGLTESGFKAEVLQKVTMPVIDNIKCLASDRDFFGKHITENVFCAGYTNGTGVCNGDSGGGMVFQRSGLWYVGGIVSHSKSRSFGDSKCTLDGYGVFTKVQKYISWIQQKTGLSFMQRKTVELYATFRYPECRPGKVNPKKTTSPLLPRLCGRNEKNRNEDNKAASLYEFPWMVQVLDDEGNSCAGSLINNRYVLTISSCLIYKKDIKIRLGEHTIGQTEDCNEDGDCAPPVQDFGIQCVSFHTGLYPFRYQIDNNLALIRLDKNVTFGDRIFPICLPKTAALQQMKPPSEYIVSGWNTEYEKEEKVRPLLKRTIQHKDISECHRSSLPLEKLVAFKICANSNITYDICIDDLGAPAGYGVDDSFVQFGIVPSPYWCEGNPVELLKVASFMDWIVANIEA